VRESSGCSSTELDCITSQRNVLLRILIDSSINYQEATGSEPATYSAETNAPSLPLGCRVFLALLAP
jgi:hypothetical protein